jgi:hypothetical protein
MTDALARIPCRSAILDAELCLPGAGDVPDFYRMPAAMGAVVPASSSYSRST